MSKRNLEIIETTSSCTTCTKRACMAECSAVSIDTRLPLSVLHAHLKGIEAWMDALRQWKSLRDPVPKPTVEAIQPEHWLDDHAGTCYEPGHNPELWLTVKHAVAAHYPFVLSPEAMAIVDKWADCIDGRVWFAWDSPVELLLCDLLYNDVAQKDFLTLAQALVDKKDTVENGNQLLALCCWAITARQFADGGKQETYTRNALANIVALALVLKNGPTFRYSDMSYAFHFDALPDETPEIRMHQFACFWFGVEMPNFAPQDDAIMEKFRALIQ